MSGGATENRIITCNQCFLLNKRTNLLLSPYSNFESQHGFSPFILFLTLYEERREAFPHVRSSHLQVCIYSGPPGHVISRKGREESLHQWFSKRGLWTSNFSKCTVLNPSQTSKLDTLGVGSSHLCVDTPPPPVIPKYATV